MSIWFKNYSLEELNALNKGTLAETLGMKFTEIGEDYLVMTMPVNEKTMQPFGRLHGGANAALAENVSSIAGVMCVDTENFGIVGLDLNCNHLRGVTNGFVTATTKPFHVGRTTQVWEIKICNEEGKLVNISRMTLAVLKK